MRPPLAVCADGRCVRLAVVLALSRRLCLPVSVFLSLVVLSLSCCLCRAGSVVLALSRCFRLAVSVVLLAGRDVGRRLTTAKFSPYLCVFANAHSQLYFAFLPPSAAQPRHQQRVQEAQGSKEVICSLFLPFCSLLCVPMSSRVVVLHNFCVGL